MMKKIFILLLALCLSLTAACSGAPAQTAPAAEETQQPAAEAPSTAEASDGDLVLPYDDASGTDTPADDASVQTDTDLTALSAAECVEDLASYEGKLPHITLDCPGADAINMQIEESFIPLAEDPMNEDMYYTYSKGAGRVLSLLIVVKGPNDTVFYTPYNLDLSTGQALTGADLLALLGVEEEHLRNLEQAVMGEEFVHQYGKADDQPDAAFYEEQYALTTAPENTDIDRVWLAEDGQLCFVGRIYAMAGAEYYEYILGSTLFFQ